MIRYKCKCVWKSGSMSSHEYEWVCRGRSLSGCGGAGV